MTVDFVRAQMPDVQTPCIDWPKSCNRVGYGRRRFRGVTMGAHRAAWIEQHGDIPTGMTVDHMCFNTRCVNVEHLRLLTNEENAGNQRDAYKTHCANGHEYTPRNTYRYPGTYRRACRACNLARYHARVARGASA